MNLRLPFLLFICIFAYLHICIFVFSSVSAQEPTPTAFPNSITKDKSNPLEDFINSLLGNKIPATLEQINKASLPYAVGQGVQPVVQPTEEKTGQSQTDSFRPQETRQSNNTPLYDAASQYTVASSVRTPETTSIDVGDFFKNLIKDLADLIGIRNVGNQQAEKMINSQVPGSVTEELLTKEKESKEENLISQDNNKVLGLTSQSREGMLGGLPILQCASLPYGFCDENYSPRWINNLAATPPIQSSSSSNSQ